MKKTLLFILTLLTTIGAWAEDVTVGLTATTDNTAKTISAPVFTGSGTDITISDAILRGSEINAIAAKSLYIGNVAYAASSTWRKSVNSNNDSKFVESANQWVGYELNVAQTCQFSIKSAHVHIMVSDDINLFWKVKILDGNDKVLYTSLEKKSTRAADTDFTVDFTSEGLESTLAALTNLNGKIKVRIYVSQKGSTKYFGSDAITLTGELNAVSQTNYQKPTITVGAYDKVNGTYAVTLTKNDDDGVVNYTVGSNAKVIGAASGTTIDVAPNTTITATVSGSSYDESAEQSLTTPAAPKLTAPTITLGGFDFAANSYAATLACAEGSIKYSTNNGASWNDYTEAISVAPAATVKAKAEMANMTESDVLSFTAPAAPADGTYATPTTAGTYTDGMTYNAGAFTIPSTNSYIGAQISSGNSSINGSIKMRISRNADPSGSQDSKYGFHILVNPGYVLTSVNLQILNNYNTSIALTGVYVDNSTDNLLATPIALPYSSAKTVLPAVANISNIAATQKVVFVFEKTEGTDNPNQAQVLLSADAIVPVYNTAVTADGFGTMCYAKELVCPEGTTAYTGTLTDGYLTLTALENGVIPANTPVVINGAGGLFTLGTSGTAAVVSDLKGTTEAIATSTVEGGTVCVLGYENEKAGFYRYEGETLAANKAYLVVSEAAPARINIVINDTTTGISEINTATTRNNMIYNLAGQRVNANAKGVVIMNGKKFVK